MTNDYFKRNALMSLTLVFGLSGGFSSGFAQDSPRKLPSFRPPRPLTTDAKRPANRSGAAKADAERRRLERFDRIDQGGNTGGISVRRESNFSVKGGGPNGVIEYKTNPGNISIKVQDSDDETRTPVSQIKKESVIPCPDLETAVNLGVEDPIAEGDRVILTDVVLDSKTAKFPAEKEGEPLVLELRRLFQESAAQEEDSPIDYNEEIIHGARFNYGKNSAKSYGFARTTYPSSADLKTYADDWPYQIKHKVRKGKNVRETEVLGYRKTYQTLLTEKITRWPLTRKTELTYQLAGRDLKNLKLVFPMASAANLGAWGPMDTLIPGISGVASSLLNAAGKGGVVETSATVCLKSARFEASFEQRMPKEKNYRADKAAAEAKPDKISK